MVVVPRGALGVIEEPATLAQEAHGCGHGRALRGVREALGESLLVQVAPADAAPDGELRDELSGQSVRGGRTGLDSLSGLVLVHEPVFAAFGLVPPKEEPLVPQILMLPMVPTGTPKKSSKRSR